MTWDSSIDPSTIPDGVVFSEAARRNSRKRKVIGRNGGRKPKCKPCVVCGEMFGVVAMKKHKHDSFVPELPPVLLTGPTKFPWET